MRVNIYKAGSPVKEIINVSYAIIQKDKTLEIECHTGDEWYFEKADYDWFNIIDQEINYGQCRFQL